MLALLFARKGIAVTLLEAHKDFDRAFRGDSLNPAVLEVMAELGLDQKLLEMPHCKMQTVTVQTQEAVFTTTDYSRLKTRYPFIVLLPQYRFIEFLVTEAKRYPNFDLLLGASVQELIRENERVQGVIYRDEMGFHEIRANLTVGADGRASRTRNLAGLKLIDNSPPMDVLWFRMPRLPEDPNYANLAVYTGHGYYLALTDRPDHWQISYVIPKGSYPEIKARGIDSFRKSITNLIPEFTGRANTLKEWHQILFLSVRSSYLRRWYLPGLLLLGDAAHVMSSVGGMGIHCAIMDAVATANILTPQLRTGSVSDKDLARVQKRRMWPTLGTQWLQSVAQRTLTEQAMDPNKSFQMPLVLRIPFIQTMAARVTAFGIRPEHVQN